jgi:endonuclease-3
MVLHSQTLYQDMADDPEPERNIAGGQHGGGEISSIAQGTAATRAATVVERLGELYWTKTYGGREAFECLVRTILSQNTSDEASQPAHDSLMDQYAGTDLAVRLAGADVEVIAECIQSAGLYNRKAKHIQRAAEEIVETYGDAAAFNDWVQSAPAVDVRERLLEMNGVGPKTADCVLLFAGGRDGVFPVDTHVHRIYRRLGIAPPDADHEAVRSILEEAVPAEACGFGHTASLQFGREYCSARDPACLDETRTCPIGDLCDQVGIQQETGTAVDPADVDSQGPR